MGTKTETVRINLTLPGDGWWIVTFTVAGKLTVTTRTDAGRPVREALTAWVEALAAGEEPQPIKFDEEPGDVVLRLEPTEVSGQRRLAMVKDMFRGTLSVDLDVVVDSWEFAKAIDSALWGVGPRVEWSENTNAWLE